MLFFQIVTLVLATASTLEAAPHDISTSPTGTDPNVGSHTEDLAENSGGNLERRGFPLLAGIGVVRAVGFIVATVGTALFVNQALTPKEPEKQRFTAPPQVITPTPTSTTTSSIQTQSCNVCIACADTQAPETPTPRPEEGEWFPDYDRSHGHLPRGDKLDELRKLLAPQGGEGQNVLQKREQRVLLYVDSMYGVLNTRRGVNTPPKPGTTTTMICRRCARNSNLSLIQFRIRPTPTQVSCIFL